MWPFTSREVKEPPRSPFFYAFGAFQKRVFDNAKLKGFWPAEGRRNVGEAIALIHSELSELLEAMRDGNPPSKKIPGFSMAEEELADVVIRVMDLAAGHGLRLAAAIEAKAKHNESRPYKHGRAF